MLHQARLVEVLSENRTALEESSCSSTSDRRVALRAWILPAASEDASMFAVAVECGVTPQTVAWWRSGFLEPGVEHLSDTSQLGESPKCDRQTECRALAGLNERPLEGSATCTGDSYIEAQGEVSHCHVWRVLRACGKHLQRRRSWCVNTDPQSVTKLIYIVGSSVVLPGKAVVISLDEDPHNRVLGRTQSWLKLPNGDALTSFPNECKRYGTTTLLAALEEATDQVSGAPCERGRRVWPFVVMKEAIVACRIGIQLRVNLDGLNTRRPKDGRWHRVPPSVQFDFRPIPASWQNHVEIWFHILSDSVLRMVSFTSPRHRCEAIGRCIKDYNPKTPLLDWTEKAVY